MNNVIESVSSYISTISEFNKKAIHLRQNSVSSISFYRGQSNYDWGLTPRLYRENLLNCESVLISEFLRLAPLEFHQMGYFNTLVKMQHYGLPTRLLDTTLNPLVALFFACHGDEQKSKNGSVVLFPNLPVFKPESSPITLTMKYIFDYSGYNLDIQKFMDDVITSRELFSAHSAVYKTTEDVIQTLVNVPFYAVLPTLSNQRILNQDGSFLVYGMKLKEKVKSENPSNYEKEYYYFDTVEFDNEVDKIWPKSILLKIPSHKKDNILEELEFIGITKNRMFPELEYQSEFITKMIKKQQNIS